MCVIRPRGQLFRECLLKNKTKQNNLLNQLFNNKNETSCCNIIGWWPYPAFVQHAPCVVLIITHYVLRQLQSRNELYGALLCLSHWEMSSVSACKCRCSGLGCVKRLKLVSSDITPPTLTTETANRCFLLTYTCETSQRFAVWGCNVGVARDFWWIYLIKCIYLWIYPCWTGHILIWRAVSC